ncbi:MAG: glycosyltransferase family 39 protein [Vicinamibacterales bacterium]
MNSPTADSFAARIDAWLQHHLWLPISVVGAACTIVVVAASRSKPFWHDEIYTILMSRLPSLIDMWRAALAGVDLAPPLNLWLTRAVHAVAGVGHVATRIPAFLGFALTVFAVFAILVRRAGPTAALTGALLPFMTAGLRYASEARAYGLMMGLAAASIYCWMEAAQDRRRGWNLVLMALALAGSVWNHYFGVLAFAPIFAGELTRLSQRHRWDWGVAAAVSAALLLTLPLYPLIQASAVQRSTFWTHASAGQVTAVYAFVLNALISTPLVVAAGVAIALSLGAADVARRRRVETLSAPANDRRLLAHESAAIVVASATPLLALLLGGLTGAFAPRYALGGVAGISIAIPLLLWRVNTRRSLAELTLCGTLLYFVTGSVVTSIRSFNQAAENPMLDRPLLVRSLRSPSPTIVASSLQFLQFWYYAPTELKPRIWYLADPAEAVKKTGADTFDRGYLALSRWTPVPVGRYDDFVTAHPTFRVYQSGGGWILDKLAESGATVEEIGHENDGRLYRVIMPSRR